MSVIFCRYIFEIVVQEIPTILKECEVVSERETYSPWKNNNQ